MKFTVTAGAFANALAFAALLADDRRVKKNQALEAVHLTTDGASVKISANVLDHAVELMVSAVVEAPSHYRRGSPGSRRSVQCRDHDPGRRADRVLLATARTFGCPPWRNLPARPTLAEENGCVELAREEAIALFARRCSRPRPSRRATILRVQLHDVDDGLVAVATDGHRLARVTIPGATGLGGPSRHRADHRGR
jgi:hypothetical protein